MKNTDIEIPEQSSSTNYGDTVQTSNVLSYAERTAIKIIENMENEVTDKKEEIALLQKDIRDIEANNVIIESNLKCLSKEHRRLLELKYGQEKKDWQVGMELNIDRSTITRLKQKLIKEIGEWDKPTNLHQICTKSAPNLHVTRL